MAHVLKLHSVRASIPPSNVYLVWSNVRRAAALLAGWRLTRVTFLAAHIRPLPCLEEVLQRDDVHRDRTEQLPEEPSSNQHPPQPMSCN